MSQEKRIIKKYPNRRLYDTAISSYVTLADVRRLVTEDTPIQVIDARSEQDLTHTTLLQILVEQEEKTASILTNETLESLIRFYGNAMQSSLGQFLQEATSLFLTSQEKMKSKLALDGQTLTSTEITDLAAESGKVWQSVQEKCLENLNKPAPTVTPVSEPQTFGNA